MADGSLPGCGSARRPPPLPHTWGAADAGERRCTVAAMRERGGGAGGGGAGARGGDGGCGDSAAVGGWGRGGVRPNTAGAVAAAAAAAAATARGATARRRPRTSACADRGREGDAAAPPTAAATLRKVGAVAAAVDAGDRAKRLPVTRPPRLSECYFAGKGAALVLPPNERARAARRPAGGAGGGGGSGGVGVSGAGGAGGGSPGSSGGGGAGGGGPSGGAAPGAGAQLPPSSASGGSGGGGGSGAAGGSPDIQQHLQSMFYLLRPEETLKMAVKLESAHAGRTRYLVVVSCAGRQDAEESCLLGIDCNDRTTVGLVLRVLADTSITLDGDGGFSVSVCGRQHIFKPVSVQAMWSALQTLHKVSCKAREQNYFQGGLTHDWVSYYEQRIESDRSCLNEWHAMDSLESRRPPSPDSVRTKPRERDETERVIRSTLKEIMMSVDLDEVTSKYIRSRLEEDLDMDLGEYKSFIDQEMLTILGQMDAATEVFDHVYLGSEWNASNLEELQKNGVRHILNVTREIDNFFPGMFDYQNIRVYDDEKTDLLKHWDNTFKYITNAKKEGSKVLVHCKMGVSRSASVVIAYAMKAYNWDYKRAFDYVKQKRNCIKPNTSFVSQLETYQGILDAMKNREKLQRSKSETNLKSPSLSAKSEQTGSSRSVGESSTITGTSCESRTEPDGPNLLSEASWNLRVSGTDLGKQGNRPKSWSPDNNSANALLIASAAAGPASISLEQLPVDAPPPLKELPVIEPVMEVPPMQLCLAVEMQPSLVVIPGPPCPSCKSVPELEARNYRMPCLNGQAYSVSQNKVVHLPASPGGVVPSVKHRVNELELQSGQGTSSICKKTVVDRKGMVLNLTTQFESNGSKPGSPSEQEEMVESGSLRKENEEEEEPVLSQTKLAPQMLTAVLVKKEIWDPGEKESPTTCAVEQVRPFTSVSSFVPSTENLVWTSSTELLEKSVCEKVKYDTPVYISEVKLLDSEASEDKQVPQQSKLESGVRTCVKREGDPFSCQVDRVFDREERKQQRASVAAIPVSTMTTVPATITTAAVTVPLTPPYLTEIASDLVSRECPSRQSSWSSYDSAVVLGYQGEPRNAPSRQSSWGSGDTRWTYGGTLPSRNSSWGSYDMRPPTMQYVTEHVEKDHHPLEDFVGSSGMFPYDRQDVPWYQGTVKRTKQKLEEGSSTVKRVCSDSSSPPSTGPGASLSPSRFSEKDAQKSVSGLVQNLKKEFEAKSVSKTEKAAILRDNSTSDIESNADSESKRSDNIKVRSLPSSPVSVHPDCKSPNSVSPASTTEDLSVKKLVGRYEVSKNKVPSPTSGNRMRFISENENIPRKHQNPITQPCVPLRKSSLDIGTIHHQNNTHVGKNSLYIHNIKNGTNGGCERKESGDEYHRPPAPVSVASTTPQAVVASVMAMAASKKQQHGSTHPLSRLSINKPRHNNPVYNTM